jgi:hypothetical protein
MEPTARVRAAPTAEPIAVRAVRSAVTAPARARNQTLVSMGQSMACQVLRLQVPDAIHLERKLRHTGMQLASNPGLRRNLGGVLSTMPVRLTYQEM